MRRSFRTWRLGVASSLGPRLAAKATDFEDVQWLEFMGLSRWSEEGRVYVRGEVQKLVELTLCRDRLENLENVSDGVRI